MRPLVYRTLSWIKCQTGCRGHCTLTDEPISACKQGQGKERNQRHQEVPQQFPENYRRHKLIA